MKKNLVLTVCILSSAFTSLAQRFGHGIGVATFTYHDNVYDKEKGIAITYSPVFFFAEGRKTSFSAGMPVMLGVSNGIFGYKGYLADGTYRESTHNFMLNLPVIINFNIGAGAVKDAGYYGFFIGTGPGFNMSPVTYSRYKGEDIQNGTDHRAGIGLNFNIGMRILPQAPKNYRQNFECKLSIFSSEYGTRPFISMLSGAYNF
jgi:hypothetical protein